MQINENIIQQLTQIIKTAETRGAIDALTLCGMTSGEISQRDALRVYKSWFRDAVRDERIRPVRVGDGRSATKWYSVSEILALKQGDHLAAIAQLKGI